MYAPSVFLLFLILGCAPLLGYGAGGGPPPPDSVNVPVYLYKEDSLTENRQYLSWNYKSGWRMITIAAGDEESVWNLRPIIASVAPPNDNSFVTNLTIFDNGGKPQYLKWAKDFDEPSMRAAYNNNEPLSGTVSLSYIAGNNVKENDIWHNMEWKVYVDRTDPKKKAWTITANPGMFNSYTLPYNVSLNDHISLIGFNSTHPAEGWYVQEQVGKQWVQYETSKFASHSEACWNCLQAADKQILCKKTAARLNMTVTQFKDTCPGGADPFQTVIPVVFAANTFKKALLNCGVPLWKFCIYTLFSDELGYAYMHEKNEGSPVTYRTCVSQILGTTLWDQEYYLASLCEDMSVYYAVLRDVKTEEGAKKIATYVQKAASALTTNWGQWNF